MMKNDFDELGKMIGSLNTINHLLRKIIFGAGEQA